MSDADERFQRFNLRLPRDLMRRLAEAAAERPTSVNAEIVQRLASSFGYPPETEEEKIVEVVRAISKIDPEALQRFFDKKK